MIVDCVMWTLNGESTLPFCLNSIEKALPKNVVGQKIVVDGKSTDKTKDVCERFGWTVVSAKKRGIPFQANQALGLVETELFASFEQDIMVHGDWFKHIIKHFEDENVSVAQGVRVSVNPVLRSLELYALIHQNGYSSLDNTMYRTEDVCGVGGFNTLLLSGLDRDLQQKIRNKKLWIVDQSLVSLHLHSSLIEELKHQYHESLQSLNLGSKLSSFKRLAYSPIRGCEMAFTQNCPELILYYPLWQLFRFAGLVCQ